LKVLPVAKHQLIPLSLPRRLLVEHCHFSNATSKGVMKRRLTVPAFLRALAACGKAKPPLTIVFLRAFGLGARYTAEVRRAYVALPTPRLSQTTDASGCIIMMREHESEEAVLMANFVNPAATPFTLLMAQLAHFKTAPLDQVPDFKRSFMVARLPQPLRRFAFWLGLNWPRQRRKFFASFGVTNTGEAEMMHTVHPLTTMVSFGRIEPGSDAVDVTLSFDHRVFDGMTVTRALMALENTLNGIIAEELLDMAQRG
jgi:hypothetical protein